MTKNLIGHNSAELTVKIEVRLFNSLAKFLPKEEKTPRLTFKAGSTIVDILDLMEIPKSEVFLALCNGRDVSPGLIADGINAGYAFEEGDVIALSGPVPFSWGYGAPVV